MAWRSYGYGSDYYGFRPYVSVAQRRAKAAKAMDKLRKKGADIQPVTIEGRKIASTFWGEAWCDHLESFSDFENRLPRGRTYVRNGSVCHLGIEKGKIEAKVCGSELYTVKIDIKTLAPAKWTALKTCCAGQVGSMLELLQGKLSDRVMTIVTDRNEGLFPLPKEIHLSCSCPDYATMCKHVAAVLYGVGARLDHTPELLFLLRGVDHQELVSEDAAQAVVAKGSRGKGRKLDEASLGDVFGIELASAEPDAPAEPVTKRKTAKKAVNSSKKKTTPVKTKKAAAKSPSVKAKKAVKSAPAANGSQAKGKTRTKAR